MCPPDPARDVGMERVIAFEKLCGPVPFHVKIAPDGTFDGECGRLPKAIPTRLPEPIKLAQATP